MCLAIPMKIEKINAACALASAGPVRTKINVCLIARPRVGDYVLVHAGIAIEKIDSRKAAKALELYRKVKVL